MDTIETNEPSGEAEFTPSADTSVSDTQPVETGDVNVTETEETGQAEAPLLAGKYKSAEELEKAYNEIQQLNGQLSQKAQLANLLEKQTGMNTQQIQELMAQQEEQKRQEQLANDPTFLLRQENNQLKAEKALRGVNQEIDALIKEQPAYEAHRDKILKLALTDGIGWKTEYNPATGQNETVEVPIQELASEWIGGAIAEGQRTAYNKIDTKLMSQTTGVQSAPQSKITAEDMKNMSTSDMEKFLPHAS